MVGPNIKRTDMTSKLDTEIALLKRDIETHTEVSVKLETSIGKISEVLGNLAKIVAVHEEKHDKQDRLLGEIALTAESRRIENNNSYKDLTQKLDDIRDELKQDLSKEIEDSEDRILEKWDKQQTEAKADDDKKEEKKDVAQNQILARISNLEKWRWILVGIGTAVGFLAGKIPFTELQHLFIGGVI